MGVGAMRRREEGALSAPGINSSRERVSSALRACPGPELATQVAAEAPASETGPTAAAQPGGTSFFCEERTGSGMPLPVSFRRKPARVATQETATRTLA